MGCLFHYFLYDDGLNVVQVQVQLFMVIVRVSRLVFIFGRVVWGPNPQPYRYPLENRCGWVKKAAEVLRRWRL